MNVRNSQKQAFLVENLLDKCINDFLHFILLYLENLDSLLNLIYLTGIDQCYNLNEGRKFSKRTFAFAPILLNTKKLCLVLVNE